MTAAPVPAGRTTSAAFPSPRLSGTVLSLLLTLVVAMPGGAQSAPLAATAPAEEAPSRWLAFASTGPAQEGAQPRVLSVPVGNSTVVVHPATLDQVSIGNPEVADAVVVSANEVVINGKSPGTTTLLIWDGAGGRAEYTVRVIADAPGLERELDRLFPEEDIRVSAVGGTLVLSGQVRDPQVARKAMSLARALSQGAEVMDNMSVPDPGQVLLKVRFAEVSRNALNEYGPELYLFEDDNVATALGTANNIRTSDDEDFAAEVVSDAVNFFLFHKPSNVQAFIRALQARGIFKSLAEPNLLAMPAETASFLAGGEFPFPVLQGGAASNAVTIQFKEFGIRLNFVPNVTNSGAIRLRVSPEVSSLDFANGLEVAGFRIPALLARRAETVVELESGQTFAIAGLLDNALTQSVSKIPILGDIPVLGALFRSEDMRQNRSELLVLVTPQLVQPLDRSPPVPTGEPETWKWEPHMRPETGTEEGGPGRAGAGDATAPAGARAADTEEASAEDAPGGGSAGGTEDGAGGSSTDGR